MLTEINNLFQLYQQNNSSTIKDYQIGNLVEITNKKSQDYPLMYVEVDKFTANEQTMICNFNIAFAEQENVSHSNRIEILNNTLNLHNDFINYLYKNIDTEEIQIDKSIALTPFVGRFNNIISGWFSSVSITITRPCNE